MLSKYDALLSGARKYDDYWSDVAISDAIAFLESFSDQAWAALEILVVERPSLWQVGCAETLSEATNTKRSLALLLRLMQVGDDDVIVAALDSINALASYGLDISGEAEQLRNAVVLAKSNAGVAVSRMLNALEEKLPPA